MVKKCNSQTQFKKEKIFRFFSRFVRVWLNVKITNMIKHFFHSSCNMGIKKFWIWCWFRIRWKSCKKSNTKKVIKEKVTAIWSLWLLLLSVKFFGVIFSHCFQRSRIPFHINVRLQFVKKVKIVVPYCTCLPIKPQLANT
jgi:hypothetical protein